MTFRPSSPQQGACLVVYSMIPEYVTVRQALAHLATRAFFDHDDGVLVLVLPVVIPAHPSVQ